MIGVHEVHVAEYLERGYVPVKTVAPRVWMSHPRDTCLRQMRYGLCSMDAGHRGRCSTVTFYCDACGKTRRGTPWSANEDVAYCWFCENVREGP